VFYLHHRTSEDLDLFTVEPVDLSELSFWIRTVWKREQAIVRSTPQFLSMLLDDVFVDFYFLLKEVPELNFETVFELAKKREALLDDPPTAAYQLEEGAHFMRNHPQLVPPLKRPLNHQELFAAFDALVEELYKRGKRLNSTSREKLP
jgi:hypothetical protein